MNNTANSLSRWEYQNLALAAVAQCAALVERLAVRGEVHRSELIASINPLMVLDPPSMDAIYPNPIDFSLGLRSIQGIFANERMKEHAELVRYTLGLLLLRNHLDRDSEMQDIIRQRLQSIPALTQFNNIDANLDLEDEQDEIIGQLAALYQDTISTLSYRIQVQGKVDNLKNEKVANKIRALLLAGIRSAVLWHQLGGRRWRLLVYRKRIHETAGNIRRKLITTV